MKNRPKKFRKKMWNALIVDVKIGKTAETIKITDLYKQIYFVRVNFHRKRLECDFTFKHMDDLGFHSYSKEEILQKKISTFRHYITFDRLKELHEEGTLGPNAYVTFFMQNVEFAQSHHLEKMYDEWLTYGSFISIMLDRKKSIKKYDHKQFLCRKIINHMSKIIELDVEEDNDTHYNLILSHIATVKVELGKIPGASKGIFSGEDMK